MLGRMQVLNMIELLIVFSVAFGFSLSTLIHSFASEYTEDNFTGFIFVAVGLFSLFMMIYQYRIF
jgi:hypothetical protein